jgi:hypothetical protein
MVQHLQKGNLGTTRKRNASFASGSLCDHLEPALDAKPETSEVVLLLAGNIELPTTGTWLKSPVLDWKRAERNGKPDQACKD